MPTYPVIHKETGEKKELSMTMVEYSTWRDDNPEWDKDWNAGVAGLGEFVASGETIYLRGFGSFGPKVRAKKTARNISNNTTIIIPEHTAPYFKPSKSFVKKVMQKSNK